MKAFNKKSKGQVLVLVAVSMIMLLALIALAIDVGIAYTVKSKLNSAVDGAAIAAGRGVKQGSSISERKAHGRDAALRFFAANFPSNFMGSSLLSAEPTINIPDPVNGTWTISVNGQAKAPIFFSKAVGWPNLTVNALAETTVRDLDMIIVLDTSGSLDDTNSPPGTFDTLKASAINFINRFSDGPGGDRIGVVPFASGAATTATDGYVAINTVSRGFNKSAIVSAISNLPVGGTTASEEALRKAKVDLDSILPQNRSSLRIIVFFSDGAPNDIAGTFGPGATAVTGTLYSETVAQSSCGEATGRGHRTWNHDRRNYPNGGTNHGCNIAHLPNKDHSGTVNLESFNLKRTLEYDGINIKNNRCNVNKAARNMFENVANTARSGSGTDSIKIYTLGLGSALNENEIGFCGYDIREYGANILKRVANTKDSDTYNPSQPTGLYVYAENASQLDAAFQTIANQILRLTK